VPAPQGQRQSKVFLAVLIAGSRWHAEFFNGGNWHLFQNVIEIKRSYARNTFDTDVINPATPYFGQWTSHGPAAPHNPAAAADILASRAFVKKTCVISPTPDNEKLRTAPKAVRVTSTCRILTPEINGYFGVSLTEDDAVDGYVHKSDLLLGGLLGNLPGSESKSRCFPAPAATGPKPDAAGLENRTQRVSAR
jgi:hypothetical protein